jgi:hypothetical protein
MTVENNTQPTAAAGNEQKKARAIPDEILRLLGRPPVLPTESVPKFLEIFESFTSAIPPRTVLDYYLIFDITVLTFEVIRYRRMKVAILKNLERPVVEGFFRKTHEGSALTVCPKSS